MEKTFNQKELERIEYNLTQTRKKKASQMKKLEKLRTGNYYAIFFILWVAVVGVILNPYDSNIFTEHNTYEQNKAATSHALYMIPVIIAGMFIVFMSTVIVLICYEKIKKWLVPAEEIEKNEMKQRNVILSNLIFDDQDFQYINQYFDAFSIGVHTFPERYFSDFVKYLDDETIFNLINDENLCRQSDSLRKLKHVLLSDTEVCSKIKSIQLNTLTGGFAEVIKRGYISRYDCSVGFEKARTVRIDVEF